MRSVKDTLIATKQFVETHEWIQGQLTNHNGGYCLLGVLDEVEPDGQRLPVYRFLCEHLQVSDGGVSIWNDKFGRTKQDVLDMLDKAIEASEKAP
jgi:hypothetical protein